MSKGTRALLLFVFGTWSVFSIMRTILYTLTENGATDFHSYWYYGHFIWQKVDPYQAYFKQHLPTLPVNYLDGEVIEHYPIAQPYLAAVPANTAPVVLILSIFSKFSWPLAKIMWLTVNFIMALLIPFFVLRSFPDRYQFSNTTKWIVFLYFFSVTATRNALIGGQTTILIFALMLVSYLFWETDPIISGLLLGLALSKYSLALPLLIFYFMKKQGKIIIFALLIQFLGLIVLAFCTSTPVLQIVSEYFLMLTHHVAEPGVHLWNLVPIFGITTWVLVIVATINVYWVIIKRLHYTVVNISKNCDRLLDLQSLNILCIWTLLVVYHREYDVLITILFVTIIFSGIANKIWKLSKTVRAFVMSFTLIFMAWMMRPLTSQLLFFSDRIKELWYTISTSGYVTTLMLMGALVVSVYLLSDNILRNTDYLIFLDETK